jgi:hypothetical protein
MATAKVKLSSEMQYIQEALKSGRATLQKFSMRRLTRLDKSLQPRVVHLDMDHVKNLGDNLQVQLAIGRDLYPGVLFHDPAKDWVGLVDGWHRLKAYQIAGLDYFPAYVVEGTKEDAIEYAAMANQHAILRRTKEDVRKQIFMLLEIPRWLEKSEKEVAKHVGVSAPTVNRHRAAFCRDRGVWPRNLYTTHDGGIWTRRRRNGDLPRIIAKPNGKKTAYVTCIKGKTIYLGLELSRAKVILDEKLASMDLKRTTLKDDVFFQSWLWSRGISLDRPKFPPGVYRGLGNSAHGYGRVVITARLDEPGAVYTAIGRLYALRHILRKPDHRLVMVCVCYPDDGPEALVQVARDLDVELLTPDEFVAGIKAETDAGANGKGSS